MAKTPRKPKKVKKGKRLSRKPQPGLADTVRESARRSIEKALNAMSAGASRYSSPHVSIHVNSDGTIDGECRMTAIRGNISMDSFLLHIEAFAKAVLTGSHLFKVKKSDTTTWFTIIQIRPSRPGDVEKSGALKGPHSGFRKRGGAYESYVSTYWRKATRYRMPQAWLLARDINKNFAAKRRLRAHTIVYRLSWNAQGVRP